MTHSRIIKHALIALTLISVVADTMVLPFYPQFFDIAFGITSAEHVGYYIAACCFTVMVAFPFWAKVARKIHELHLWIYTQLAAAALGVFCYFSTDIVQFWLASQLMLIFKASYLLIYPFVMRLEEKNKHLGVAALFAVLMHFGGIGGAIIGGFVLNWFDAKDLYLVMPLSDVIQVAMCFFLIYILKTPFFKYAVSPDTEQPALNNESETTIANATTNSKSDSSTNLHTNSNALFKKQHKIPAIIWKLCVASALFYYSAFLIRPFFTRYWETLTGWENTFATGLVYSIPAWVALVCLWVTGKRSNKPASKVAPITDIQKIIHASLLGLVGLFMQGPVLHVLPAPELVVVLGRCLFGFAFFQISVRLEVLLFENSSPDHYATDFSKLHFFQNIGVIASSFSVGYIVSQSSIAAPFHYALIGLAISLVAFYALFNWQSKKIDLKPKKIGQLDTST